MGASREGRGHKAPLASNPETPGSVDREDRGPAGFCCPAEDPGPCLVSALDRGSGRALRRGRVRVREDTWQCDKHTAQSGRHCDLVRSPACARLRSRLFALSLARWRSALLWHFGVTGCAALLATGAAPLQSLAWLERRTLKSVKFETLQCTVTRMHLPCLSNGCDCDCDRPIGPAQQTKAGPEQPRHVTGQTCIL